MNNPSISMRAVATWWRCWRRPLQSRQLWSNTCIRATPTTISNNGLGLLLSSWSSSLRPPLNSLSKPHLSLSSLFPRRLVKAACFGSQTRIPDTTLPPETGASSPADPEKTTIHSSSSATKTAADSSNPTKKKKKRMKFVPRKAAVNLTPRAREFFKSLLGQDPLPRPDIIGIKLNYEQSSTGEPRMVFSFQFVTAKDLGPFDEAVSLDEEQEQEAVVSAEPSSGKPQQKLYISGNAFLKVLGATVDVDTETLTPILYDKEGNRMDPNA